MCAGGLQLSSAARFTELVRWSLSTLLKNAIFPFPPIYIFFSFFIFAKLVNVKGRSSAQKNGWKFEGCFLCFTLHLYSSFWLLHFKSLCNCEFFIESPEKLCQWA